MPCSTSMDDVPELLYHDCQIDFPGPRYSRGCCHVVVGPSASGGARGSKCVVLAAVPSPGCKIMGWSP